MALTLFFTCAYLLVQIAWVTRKRLRITDQRPHAWRYPQRSGDHM